MERNQFLTHPDLKPLPIQNQIHGLYGIDIEKQMGKKPVFQDDQSDKLEVLL
jgi:hypothetical protein